MLLGAYNSLGAYWSLCASYTGVLEASPCDGGLGAGHCAGALEAGQCVGGLEAGAGGPNATVLEAGLGVAIVDPPKPVDFSSCDLCASPRLGPS